MAYADQQGMSSNRLISIIIVILLHAFLGYALVTGLAFQAVQQVKKSLNVIDVKEEKPPEEEPPPPPPEQKQVAPPPVTVTKSPVAPTVNFTPPAPPVPPVMNFQPPAVPAPVAPPPPPPVAKRPKPIPKNNVGSWANAGDYPSRALQQEREGTTRFTVTVGPNGRVTNCSVTGSSGSPDLDQVACTKITSRARFDPALDSAGQPTTGTYSNSVRWQIPKD